MELRQLKHFIGVATEGSFTKAALALNITQPALTRSVKLLEGRYKTTLFTRTAGGVDLTSDGIALLRHASLILNSLEAAQMELMSSAEGGYTELRVGLASLFTNKLADRCISECVQLYENFRASIEVGLYEDMEENLRDGALDLVLTASTETNSASGLVFEPLCEIASAVFAGSHHPLYALEDVSLQDLRDADWVTLHQPHMEAFLPSFFASAGLAAPQPRVRTMSLQMLRSLVRQHELVGFLPLHWAEDDIESGRLKVLPVPNTPIYRTAGVITRKGALRSKAANLFVDRLRKIAAEP